MIFGSAQRPIGLTTRIVSITYFASSGIIQADR